MFTGRAYVPTLDGQRAWVTPCTISLHPRDECSSLVSIRHGGVRELVDMPVGGGDPVGFIPVSRWDGSGRPPGPMTLSPTLQAHRLVAGQPAGLDLSSGGLAVWPRVTFEFASSWEFDACRRMVKVRPRPVARGGVCAHW